MKKKQAFYAPISIVVLSILTIQFGCKNNNDDPEPARIIPVWAVGAVDSTNYGTILYSTDGGEEWVRQGDSTVALLGVSLSDVWAVDENKVWAVGTGNVILKTTDKGETWNRIPAPSQRPDVELNSISLIGSDNIWIGGSYGTVYNSADGGNTWTTVVSEVFNNKYFQGIHAINSNVIYVTGGYEGNNTRGFIARTTDGGQSWDSITPADNYNKNLWIGITSSDPNNIIVYGGESHYIYSNDGGQTWTNDSILGTGGTDGADINCLTMPDANTWWGAFDYDYIGLTSNAGDLWNKQTSVPPLGMWLLGIDYYNYDQCVIVGSSSSSNNGKIIQTTDAGKNWNLRYETDAWMQKVSFIK